MGRTKEPAAEPSAPPPQNPLDGLKEYLEGHQQDSVFEREKETVLCLFLHGGRELVGRIEVNEPYEIQFLTGEGVPEKIHKVQVNFLCAEGDRQEVLKQIKRGEPAGKKPVGPHYLPRFRHHIKNKSLYPLMNRREVLYFTLLNGEVLRGIVSGFSRYEINLNLKRGVPVVILRHAVAEVRDKKDRSFLKKAVEKTRKYW